MPELLSHEAVQEKLDNLRKHLEAATNAVSLLTCRSTRKEIRAAYRSVDMALGNLHWLVRGRLPDEHQQQGR
jgi:hypothetical protein